jgi:hypothetical protein
VHVNIRIGRSAQFRCSRAGEGLQPPHNRGLNSDSLVYINVLSKSWDISSGCSLCDCGVKKSTRSLRPGLGSSGNDDHEQSGGIRLGESYGTISSCSDRKRVEKLALTADLDFIVDVLYVLARRGRRTISTICHFCVNTVL